MTQVTRFTTSNTAGVDVNNTYTVSASTTPEYPAPPVVLGTEVIGTNGAQYIFCQASTSITANDFVGIQTASSYQAISLTSTVLDNASLGVRIGVAPGSPVVTSLGIAAGTYFWAAINGSNLLGRVFSSSNAGVQLYTTASAGVVSSVTVTLNALGGVVVTGSVTTSLTAATFNLSWPRLAVQLSLTVASPAGAQAP